MTKSSKQRIIITVMKLNFFDRHPVLQDAIGVAIFIVSVIIGTVIINSFVFRSYSVVGPSMESTLYTNDRLIVNRVPSTISHIRNQTWVPERGDVIVFKNPQISTGLGDEYLVKRVIGLPGERVVVQDGEITVYNNENPDGFNPDNLASGGEPGSPTSGSKDIKVPDNEIFVSGDHRQDGFSYDSRNGLGTVPLYDVIGPVTIRIFPFDKMRFF